jgi:ribosomal protein S18 acetylase RimI-like enzyme
MSDSTLQIGLLEPSELDRACHVLGRAFRDNPLNRAVMPGRSPAARVRANEAGLRCQLASASQGGLVLGARKGGRLRGALLACFPRRYPLPLPPLPLRLWAFLMQGRRVSERWSQVFDSLDAVHPLAPHWYLGVLGVAPEAAGCGIGTALLRTLLARVADEPLPVYLETDSRRNLGFYARQGFRVTRELHVLGVSVWCLERPAGGSAPRVA